MNPYGFELVIPSVETGEERLAQLQDEIDRILQIIHYKDWAEGRVIDTDYWKITYPDGGMISISEPMFTVLVGNQEIQEDSLEKAENWLWINHSSSNYIDRVESPKITCKACIETVHFGISEHVHTRENGCRLKGEDW